MKKLIALIMSFMCISILAFAGTVTFNSGAGSGTVTQINTDSSLTGGPITNTGTLGVNWSQSPSSTTNWQSISNYSTNNILQATTAGGVNWTNLNSVGGVSWVATVTPSAVSSVTISGLNTSTKYTAKFKLTQNTSNGILKTQFNGDSGNNYGFIAYGYNWLGALNDDYSIAFSAIENSGNTTLATSIIIGEETFYSAETNKVRAFGQCSLSDAAAKLLQQSMAGLYSGGAGLSSVTFLTSAGTLSGDIEIYKYN